MRIAARDGAFHWRAMASPVSLHLPRLGQEVGYAVALAVAEDLEKTEQALSRFRESAELVWLNDRVGHWSDVSPRLYTALATAFRANRRTGGLFDPTIIGTLEAIGYRGARRSADRSVEGTPWLERSPRARRVRLWRPVDLGGIGKGLGLRFASSIVRRITQNFLLNAGGDLVVAGEGPDGKGWSVGVEDPTALGQLIAALRLVRGGAVCTSSIARLRWIHEEEQVHHLLDPRTGRPGGAGLLSVTVVGRDPAWAEVETKALFLCGPDKVAKAAGRRAALWVTSAGVLGATPEAKELLFWQRPAATDASRP